MTPANPRWSFHVAKPQTDLLDKDILIPAIGASFRKLDPRAMARNPVMFVVEVVAALTTVLFVRDVFSKDATLLFTG